MRPSREHELPSGASIQVEVLTVVDGDTFVARRDDRLFLMRLRDVEAPDVNRPEGVEARERLGATLTGRHVTVRTGQVEGCVVSVRAQTPDGADVAEEMLSAGWVSAGPSAPEPWRRLEDRARSERLGLWRAAAAERP